MRALTTTFCIIIFCATSIASAEETLRISVASSLLETIFSKIKTPFEKESGVKLVFLNSAKGTEFYFKELLDGQADAAAASISYADWLKVMEKAKIPVPPNANITQRVIGYDLMIVTANEAAGVTKLTSDQVLALLMGKAKSWKAVGGNDVPVTVYFAAEKPNRMFVLQKNLLNGQPYTDKSKTIDLDSNMLVEMAKDPGALAVVASKPKVPKLRAIETPQLGRPATLITKGRPSPALEKLVTFIRNNQKLITAD